MNLNLPMPFDRNKASVAAQEWGFNCGPAAICAVLNVTPNKLRANMGNFEQKGYTNPGLMKEVLLRCGAKIQLTYRKDEPHGMPIVQHGVMRVQWGGPWTKPGVPMRVRYRHTHWVAVRNHSAEVFDVNAVGLGGWIKESVWATELVPWLIQVCEPKGDGSWWPTHVFEVEL